jgi:two-component system, OmpR family, alkaline phosphatase synthesis response regulator PhoP
MYKILVVDDEPDICEILKFNLENQGYFVDTANSAEEAIGMGVAQYHLLLLDVMMDKMSGFAMAKHLKENQDTAQIPIIFVTAKDTENDTLTGFNLGADDYISKPFKLGEVTARVKAVLRRTAKPLPSDVAEKELKILSFKDLVVDLQSKNVSIIGNEVILTKKEYEILCLLMQKVGYVFSREQILDKVWPNDVTVLERSVDVNIARLRKKLGEYASCIVSRTGYGYSFKE